MTANTLSSTKGLKSARTSRRVGRVISYALMVSLGMMFMFPWFWTLSSSLKKPSEVYIFPPLWFSKSPQPANYLTVFKTVPFAHWFRNSLVVVILSTLGAVISATLVAYSFARFRWPGRDVVFALTLATMMIPAEVTLIPQYLLFKNLKWLNSIKPLWVPAWFGGGAFLIFLLRQFIMTIPRELDEAATIDGANPVGILFAILIPLMKPVLATVCVITFIGAWNDFMGPLIYLASPDKFTLALGIRYFNVTPGQAGMPEEHLLMAACVMSTLPIIILFFSAQRYFVQGIVMSGIKG